jgi:hypothetical protein
MTEGFGPNMLLHFFGCAEETRPYQRSVRHPAAPHTRNSKGRQLVSLAFYEGVYQGAFPAKGLSHSTFAKIFEKEASHQIRNARVVALQPESRSQKHQ